MTDPTPTRDEAVTRVTREMRDCILGLKVASTLTIAEWRRLLASAPAPASGGVEAVSDAQLRWIADSKDIGTCRERIRAALSVAEALSPAATPVSEAEPVATVRTIRPLMCEAVIDFIPKQNGHLPFDVGSKLYALAKPASSPAGGDVSELEHERWRATAFMVQRDRIVDRHDAVREIVSKMRSDLENLGGFENELLAVPADGIRTYIEKLEVALSQSTSAGRVGE